jgi:hypothetical protein
MRSLATTALLGSFLLVTGVQGQSLSEHAAAAAGATIGTAAGKPLSNAITKIFGQVDNDAQKAAGVKAEPKKPVKAPVPDTAASPDLALKPSGQSAPSSSEPRRRTTSSAAPRAAYLPVTATPTIVQEPARREPTAEELANVKVGATESDVLAALGQPESRVTIPDDGHLLQICQYWANGQPLGTIRLDNGQVVSVEPKS